MNFSYRKQQYLTNIKIGSEINNSKFLGIIFDKHLTFKNRANVRTRNRYLEAYYSNYINIVKKYYL